MKECPKCKSKYIVGVEYSYNCQERYDGVSEWLCPKDAGGCGYRQGRWTGKELNNGEIESRYGERGVIQPTPTKEEKDNA